MVKHFTDLIIHLLKSKLFITLITVTRVIKYNMVPLMIKIKFTSKHQLLTITHPSIHKVIRTKYRVI